MILGPIQHEDVLLLQAVIKMTQPKKCVEFGFLQGYSSKVLLEAMTDDAALVSYDPTVKGMLPDSRFTFKKLSQTKYEEPEADFVFFDAAHELELNKETFEKVLPTLNDGAIIAVHDTGLWDVMVEDVGGHWIGNGYAHRPEERQFINWIKETYPDFQVINFHTLNRTRHGITLLQKYNKLVV